MAEFHNIKVANVYKETKDSVVITFDIPDALKEKFKFKQGQHLTLRKEINGLDVRRNYSLCTSPIEKEWKVAVKTIKDGLFSNYAFNKLKKGDELIAALLVEKGDEIFLSTSKGQSIRFKESDIRAMGRGAGGVRGMKLKSTDDAVVSCDVARDDTAILVMTEAGYGKRTQLDKFNRQGRGGQGVRGIKLTGKKGFVIAAFMVGLDDEIVALADYGRKQNVEVRFIEFMPLDATGHWISGQVVGQDEIVAAINAVHPIEVMPARGAAPADRFRYLDGGLHGDADAPGALLSHGTFFFFQAEDGIRDSPE